MAWSIDLKTRDTPWNPAASLETAELFGTHVARPILAGGHVCRRQQTGHMIASDPAAALCENLLQVGAVHIWIPGPPLRGVPE
jgi:hypothetical protein